MLAARPFRGRNLLRSTLDFSRLTSLERSKTVRFCTDPEYFATLGLRATRDRTYTADEATAGAKVAVISEAVARNFFGGEDPIGQSLDRVIDDSRERIIGVVSNAITASLRELGSAAVYQPLRDRRAARLLIRTEGPPESLTPRSTNRARADRSPRAFRDQVGERRASSATRRAAHPGIIGRPAREPCSRACNRRCLTASRRSWWGRERMRLACALRLAPAGASLTRLLLADSLRPVAIALAVGIGAAVLGSRVFSGVLYGVSATDPVAFAGASLELLAAATTAVIVPTRRAASVDPVSTLRQL
jgi:MacB-like periplasmic core domain